MVRLCQLSEIDALFTDRPPPEEIQSIMLKGKVRLFVTDSAEERNAAGEKA
jgi:DeoR/GlpR family transcriptional regulator of sugar metabolism